MIGYLYLGLAICIELVGTSCLKYSDGFSKPLPTVVTVCAFISCFFLLSRALKYINLGVAYASWSGMGLAATAVIAFIVFGEKLTIAGIGGIILIISGVLILNMYGTAH